MQKFQYRKKHHFHCDSDGVMLRYSLHKCFFILVCLNSFNQEVSKTNMLMGFYHSSSAEWGQPEGGGKSKALWLICSWSLPQTDAKSVCVPLNVKYLLWESRSRSASSDDIFISVAAFFSSLFWAAVPTVELRRGPSELPAVGWLKISPYTLWASGGHSSPSGAQALMENSQDSQAMI